MVRPSPNGPAEPNDFRACQNPPRRTVAHTLSQKDLTMTRVAAALLNDEAGFIVSAELVLISTITVIGMVVGLSEVAIGINNELEDDGSAFGALNQSYSDPGACAH